jgi:hypothetical protein
MSPSRGTPHGAARQKFLKAQADFRFHPALRFAYGTDSPVMDFVIEFSGNTGQNP